MIDDADIFRAAKLLIDQHGKDAAVRAAQRANELHFGGDIAASELWRQIGAAIEDLQREQRGNESPN